MVRSTARHSRCTCFGTGLDGQAGGNYTVDLRPEITIGVFGFNVTHEDEAKRAAFGDIRFREAMSLAINRDELNEVGFFGQAHRSNISVFHQSYRV